MIRILLLDNHDSFTYNLAGLLRAHRKVNYTIVQPERISMEEVKAYDKILLSPGPGIPSESPVMKELIDEYYRIRPILGICLGHQAIGIYFGAHLKNLETVVHGQQRQLYLTQPDHYLFRKIPDRSIIGLYHSWVLLKERFPEYLKVLAVSEEDNIMAISHRNFDVCGLQFHPESVITKYGKQMIDNWINH